MRLLGGGSRRAKRRGVLLSPRLLSKKPWRDAPAELPGNLKPPTSITIMSFLRKRIARRRSGMSGLGDLTSIVNSIGNALGTSVDIANDPYLPEVLCHIGQLKQINAGQTPGACADTADGLTGGVGLARAVKPMRAYVWAEQHKWAYIVGAAVVIGVPMLIGYDLGKGKR